MMMLERTKQLFYARKAAYDRAVSEALALEAFLSLDESAAARRHETSVSERESFHSLEDRRDHIDYIELFAEEVMDLTETVVVRRAFKREMLDAAAGVMSELPSEAALEKMQIPDMCARKCVLRVGKRHDAVSQMSSMPFFRL